MELENLGKGYSPNSGNTPADNIFNKVLPNAVRQNLINYSPWPESLLYGL
ncbi:MAG: hypothetical protein CM1200mP7_1340 [Chloroflexota bacterium]|nr:MAG: hypothetical protein CM1200mP7_1340 [Chloroflexota bacterium]